MGFWDSIKNAISSVGHAIGGVYDDVKSEINGGVQTVKNAVGGVYSDYKTGLSTVFSKGTDLVNKITDDTIGKGGLVDHAESIISMPLLLIGGGIAAFLLMSGKNSSFNGTASYNR